MGKTVEDIKTKIALLQGYTVDQVKPEDIANYFLSNGYDYKGQGQTGYIESGGGLGADVSIDPAKVVGLSAEVGVKAGFDRTKKDMLVVHRGPNNLDGQSFTTPIVFSCMSGIQWSVDLKTGVALGFGAEAGIGLQSNSLKSSTFLDEQDDDGSSDEETMAAGVSAFVGLTVQADAKVSRYFAFDPSPTFYSGDMLGQLRSVLGTTIDKNSPKRAYKILGLALLNEVRDLIVKNIADGKKKQNVRDALGVSTWDSEPFTDVHKSSEKFVKLLSKLSENVQANKVIFGATGDQNKQAADLKQRADTLLATAQSYHDTAAITHWTNWIQVTSMDGGASANLGAQATATVAFQEIAGVKINAELTLAALGAGYRKTYIRWQAPLMPVEKRGDGKVVSPYLCTQDTVITYARFDTTTLAAAFNAMLNVPGYKQSANTTRAVFSPAPINLMQYASATLYWKRPASEQRGNVTPLHGSGVSFGQSFIVKNLITAINASMSTKQPTTWIKRMAARLNVDGQTLMGFLQDTNVQELLQDISSGQGTDKLSWGDRAVLIESSFALNTTSVSINCTEKKLESFRDKLMQQQVALQSLRLRYRISDFTSNSSSFRLGFNVMGTGAGVTIRKIEEAGTDGIVDLYTFWMNPDLNKSMDSQATYNNATTVPPVMLFCQ